LVTDATEIVKETIALTSKSIYCMVRGYFWRSPVIYIKDTLCLVKDRDNFTLQNRQTFSLFNYACGILHFTVIYSAYSRIWSLHCFYRFVYYFYHQ